MRARVLAERTYPEMTKKTETAKWPPVKNVRATGIAAKNQLSPNPRAISISICYARDSIRSDCCGMAVVLLIVGGGK